MYRQNDCVVYARSVTQLGIDGGFVEDQQDDSVQEIIPQSNEGVGRMPIVVCHKMLLELLRNQLKKRTFCQGNIIILFLLLFYLHFKIRYNFFKHCLFVFNNLLKYLYQLQITGIDRKGNNWERVYPFYCESKQGSNFEV
uniref:Uncharacterized protein n=1 Tax=Syphacia muris TaxID=451379 RepID=A0A0N5AIY9_9BILA